MDNVADRQPAVDVNCVARLFLRARHWQMFLLLVLSPVIGQIAVMTYFGGPPSVESFDRFNRVMMVAVIMPFAMVFFGWFWAMGSFLNSIASPALRLRIVRFRFAIGYPIAYMPVFIAVAGSNSPALFAGIFLFHLFAMYCMVYCLYFVSKSVVQVESGRPAAFYDFSGPFFLLWFFPLGVWFVQPRINRLFSARGNAEAGARV
jgi:hypothetical protein